MFRNQSLYLYCWRFVIFEFLTLFILGGFNFLNSIPFLTILSVPNCINKRSLSLVWTSKKHRALPLNLAYVECLHVWPPTILPYFVSILITWGCFTKSNFFCAMSQFDWPIAKKKLNVCRLPKIWWVQLLFFLEIWRLLSLFFATKNSFGQVPSLFFWVNKWPNFAQKKNPTHTPWKSPLFYFFSFKNIHLAMSAWRNPRWGLGVGLHIG